MLLNYLYDEENSINYDQEIDTDLLMKDALTDSENKNSHSLNIIVIQTYRGLVKWNCSKTYLINCEYMQLTRINVWPAQNAQNSPSNAT